MSAFVITICPPGIEGAHAADSFDSHHHEFSEEGNSESKTHEHVEEIKTSLSYVEKNECEGEEKVIAADALVSSHGFLDMQCPALPVAFLKYSLLHEMNSVQRMPEKIDKPPPIFAGIHIIIVRE